MDAGVAHKPILDITDYQQELRERLDPTASMLNLIFEKVRSNPRRVTFAEGEDERVIRAAVAFKNAGYGTPVLIGREDRISETMKSLGLGEVKDLEIHNARVSNRNQKYTDFLYKRMQRQGLMYRDCQRLVNQDRNVFASCMLAMDDTDAVVSGATRAFHDTYEEVARVIDPMPGEQVMGLMIIVARGRTIFVADTSINETPDSTMLADIAEQAARFARSLSHTPRVAFLSASSFGNPSRAKPERICEAVARLESRNVDFEFDGEMSPSVALNADHMRRLYPFCRLSSAANVLVMPGLHTAHISTRLLQELGGGTAIGPLLIGLNKPFQIVQTGASVNDLVNAAAMAVHDALR